MTDPSTPRTPAGWYPDSTPDMERYWDGTEWSHDQVRPVAPHTQSVSVTPPAKRPWYKRKRIIIPAAVIAAIVLFGSIGSAVNGGGDDEPAAVVEQPADEPAAEEEEPEPAPDTRVTMPDLAGKTVAEATAALAAVGVTLNLPAEVGQDWVISSQSIPAGDKFEPGAELSINAAAPKPVLTLSQQNAVKSGQDYLEYSAFSRAGLVQQLSSEYGEGFPPEDAEFAVAYLEQNGLVDWNAEAAESAKDYLEYSSFSRDGLYEQLTSQYGEGFTPDQANYALGQVGY